MPKSPSNPFERQSRIQKRGFKEIPLQDVGHQVGKERFPLECLEADAEIPYLNPWRNNLTGLSQVHNLYFVAYQDVIYVYQPEFPTQKLPSESFRLSLSRSSSYLRGYMPDSRPHSVNHLLVANLGDKEIVLCACDDGDVLAFWTDQILDAVEQREPKEEESGAALLKAYWHRQGSSRPVAVSSGNEPRLSGDENGPSNLQDSCNDQDQSRPFLPIRPFFHTNVDYSAWGLAVHTGLRLIAISSNSHRVYVYAFALETSVPRRLSTELKEALIDEDTELWETLANGQGSLLGSRDSNQCRILSRHLTNIPSIAFDNATERGLLVSADINGRIITWDVDSGEAIHDMYGGDGSLTDLDQFSAGWGVMCVDRRAFTPTLDLITAMGLCHHLSNNNLCVVDISASRLNVRNAGTWQADYLFSSARRASRSQLQVPSPTPSSPSPSYASNEPDAPAEDCTLIHDHPDAGREMLLQTDCSELGQLYRRNRRGEIPHAPVEHSLTRDQADMLDVSFMFATTVETVPRRSSTLPTNTPLIFLQPQSIHLLQNTNLVERDSSHPVLFLRDPLYQPTDEGLSRLLQHSDRLNLYCQIPSLGVILIGSPKGRVAVLTLWQLDRNPILKRRNTATNSWNDVVRTFRLDHLLPLKQQETAGLRPMMQLVGLTAAPVQGCADAEKEGRCRRWRVMLMYRDHSVLSYELKRPDDKAFDGVVVN